MNQDSDHEQGSVAIWLCLFTSFAVPRGIFLRFSVARTFLAGFAVAWCVFLRFTLAWTLLASITVPWTGAITFAGAASRGIAIARTWNRGGSKTGSIR